MEILKSPELGWRTGDRAQAKTRYVRRISILMMYDDSDDQLAELDEW